MIINTEDSDLNILFNADTLIMDNWSSNFFKLYEEGKTKHKILKLLKNVEN